MGQQVQGLGGVAHKNDLVRCRAGTRETHHYIARVLVQVRRKARLIARATMHTGIPGREAINRLLHPY